MLPVATTSVLVATITGVIGDMFMIAIVFRAWSLLLNLAPVLVSLMALLVVGAVFFYIGKRKEHRSEIKLGSPFSLVSSLKFGAFYLALFGVSFFVKMYFGELGLYPLSVLTSLVSSSTFVISTVSLFVLGEISLAGATNLVVISTISSLLVKIFWVQNSKNPKFIKRIIGITVFGSVLMIVVMVLQMLFV